MEGVKDRLKGGPFVTPFFYCFTKRLLSDLRLFSGAPICLSVGIGIGTGAQQKTLQSFLII